MTTRRRKRGTEQILLHSPQPSEGTQPADTRILDFWPSELGVRNCKMQRLNRMISFQWLRVEGDNSGDSGRRVSQERGLTRQSAGEGRWAQC